MARRKRTKSEETSAISMSSSVQAIFDPAGDIYVQVVAPGGNIYEIKPRASFKIASEDVDWFFYEWNWEHRQRLSREAEYQPRRLQFNNGRQIVTRPDRPQFDNGGAPSAYRAPEPVMESEPEDPLRELLVTKPEESIEPDPIVEVARAVGDETDEDKE